MLSSNDQARPEKRSRERRAPVAPDDAAPRESKRLERTLERLVEAVGQPVQFLDLLAPDGDEHKTGRPLPRELPAGDGSRIGAAEGFTYSQALADADGVWTEEALDAFLASPATFLPGTSMQYVGITDENVRRQVIDYLKAL